MSVAPELDTLEVSEEEKATLDERWAAFLKDPASALTVEQFKERLGLSTKSGPPIDVVPNRTMHYSPRN